MCLTPTLENGCACGPWALRFVCTWRTDLLDAVGPWISPRWFAAVRPPVAELSNGLASLLNQADLPVGRDLLLSCLASLALFALAVHFVRMSRDRAAGPLGLRDL